MATKHIGQQHAGETTTVEVGDTLEVQLPENQTTGYQWQIQNGSSDVLVLENSDYAPIGTGLGAAGLRTFTFKVARAGTASLRLASMREWEPADRAAERLVYKIVSTA
jgi:inhibitor of cysteine peptidase